ncbi:DUF1840 domain-containing protein [Chitinivorax sp. B]|uniref:DUF1840 domain-containing protein n=1 Tax=Chitinivorax sp. B TaxID=2502235 RepID=UPI0010F4DF05|nr:DUF1840 domain-containing protein [Chitinivorax sp. B]
MLYIFKSKASGDVIMLDTNGKEILNLLGKDPEERKGIFTIEQLPTAISVLKMAIQTDHSKPIDEVEGEEDNTDDQETEPKTKPSERIKLYQRAFPLLEMMERSLIKQVPVTWGV